VLGLRPQLYIYENSGDKGEGSPEWALVVMHVGQAYELEAENYPRGDGDDKEADKAVEALTDKAMELYERALQVFEQNQHGDEADLDVANIAHCMGNVHNIRGEYMEAIRQYKFALENKIALMGEDHTSVGWTKNNIGNAFKGMYKCEEAIKWYAEALKTCALQLGNDHPEVAHIHWNLALLYHTKGEVDASKRKLSWNSRWPFRWLTKGIQDRAAHEGDDFEKMDKHLHHAFNVFVQARLAPAPTRK